MPIPTFLHAIVAVLLIVCNLLIIVNFAQWRHVNATVTLLLALSVTDFVYDALMLISEVVQTLHRRPTVLVMDGVGAIFRSMAAWVVLVLAVFHLQATRLGRRAAERPGSRWTVFRARLAICAVFGVTVVVHVPVMAVGRSTQHAVFRVYEALVVPCYSSIFPAIALLGVGLILAVTHWRRSHADGDDKDEDDSVAEEDVRITGMSHPPARPRQGPERWTESERQLSTAVLVIVFVYPAFELCHGVLILLHKVMEPRCGLTQSLSLFNFLVLAKNVVPVITYACVLSEFRAVFRRCCRR